MLTKIMKYLPYNESEIEEEFHAFYIPPMIAIHDLKQQRKVTKDNFQLTRQLL